MRNIILVTGNDRKVGEAKLACEPLGVEVIQKKLDVHEIQSNDPKEVSLHKAKSAFEILGEPLVVTDTFWNIPSLNGFPGAYMKDVAAWFESEDFIDLMRNKSDRTVIFSENITYYDKNSYRQFAKEFYGKIASRPRGTGISIENVAEFDGVTLGERRQSGDYSHSPENYVWIDFAEWYLKQPSL
jgi:non-canonical purine NTP pyrophosphatase (RdgB/HAM1 family)